MPKRKVRRVKKLIGGDEEDHTEEEPESQGEIIAAHWFSNLTLTIVSTGGRLDLADNAPGLSVTLSLPAGAA